MSGTIGGQFVQVPVFNAIIPSEGPKALPVDLDFSTGITAWQIDLSQAFALKIITLIQAVYIDNSAGSQAVALTVDGSRQKVVCPAGSQAFFPLLAPKDTKLTATGAAGTARLFFLNIPVPPSVWGTGSTSFRYDGSGNLLVSDPALASVVAGGALNAAVNGIASLGASRPWLTPSEFWNGNHNAATAKNIVAPSGSTFFLNALYVTLSPDATLTAAGTLDITIKDGNTILMVRRAYLDVTPANASQSVIRVEGLQYVSRGMGNALSITLSAALASGRVEYEAAGGITNFTGP